jgi:hypothetical protein
LPAICLPSSSSFPVKYYSREGFVEQMIEISDEDPEKIIRE